MISRNKNGIGVVAARYHLCGRGYYRRRARKSTWRRTKGTLNALVTSTPRRPRCSPFPFFFPERILYPKHWKEKKCWREEGRKFTGERDRFRREIFKLIRNINFSLEECAFNNSRSEPFFVHIFKKNLGIYNSKLYCFLIEVSRKGISSLFYLLTAYNSWS